MRRERAREAVALVIAILPHCTATRTTAKRHHLASSHTVASRRAAPLQVGLNAWMWSSGGLDDLVNHSCAPNLGLFPKDGALYLLSLREVAVGEELSFDYSTSMVGEPWSMECACGESSCRGVIANFLDTPSETQAYYVCLLYTSDAADE